MATVAFLVHPGREQADSLAREAGKWLERDGHVWRMLTIVGPDRVTEGGAEGSTGAIDLGGVDLAVSLGGDGTFLRLVSLACLHHVPVLGVNFGRLGHLLEISPHELSLALQQFFAGRVTIEERTLLEATTKRPGQKKAGQRRAGLEEPDGLLTDVDGSVDGGERWLALNDVVVEKAEAGHTINLTALLNEKPLARYRADGLLVATPTGSTAYNVSAGGPVLSPSLHCMVLTPIAPHLAVDRSLVVGRHDTLQARVDEGRPGVIVVDGRQVGSLDAGESLEVRVPSLSASLVTLGKRSPADALGSALQPGPDR